jgi:hypothetical protein
LRLSCHLYEYVIVVKLRLRLSVGRTLPSQKPFVASSEPDISTRPSTGSMTAATAGRARALSLAVMKRLRMLVIVFMRRVIGGAATVVLLP